MNNNQMLVNIEDDDACVCVSKHIPKPHRLYRLAYGDGYMLVCPTTYINLMKFREECSMYGGFPPGSVRKHYSEYVQALFKKLS